MFTLENLKEMLKNEKSYSKAIRTAETLNVSDMSEDDMFELACKYENTLYETVMNVISNYVNDTYSNYVRKSRNSAFCLNKHDWNAHHYEQFMSDISDICDEYGAWVYDYANDLLNNTCIDLY